jgi:hypothetical protein
VKLGITSENWLDKQGAKGIHQEKNSLTLNILELPSGNLT